MFTAEIYQLVQVVCSERVPQSAVLFEKSGRDPEKLCQAGHQQRQCQHFIPYSVKCLEKSVPHHCECWSLLGNYVEMSQQVV